ncbi:hypothetical protein [Alcaligenes endophyticus]|uniref:VOC domain-containing protein n=1 Tax=Alcaligenes endophyticus TaxID=1929088 RepID=A0ABT8EHP2_9BURK|nr:hypothetical protein [Alcaligenes endophyticus]MCX5592075.1 hypothetical protein [Alcaligenes endophyticus]MDN4120722.1 hypothetical protein [Alcaligenes endophyticus]
MFSKVDRILVAVNDLDIAQKNYEDILAAVHVGDSKSVYLNATVRTMAIGGSEVELCCPLGPGLTQSRLNTKGEGLFIGGVETTNLSSFEDQLKQQKVGYVREGDRLYPDPTALYQLPLAVSQASQRIRQPGPVDDLYELTMVLKSNWNTVAQHYADVLGLNREHEVGITFERFGYEGNLMKFNPDALDRIELSEAHDPAYPMGRYTAKHGDALYMCYIETNDLADIIQRLESKKAPYTRRTTTPVERDGLWIHPAVLNGVLLGVSRRTLAWGWSGDPKRIEPLSD